MTKIEWAKVVNCGEDCFLLVDGAVCATAEKRALGSALKIAELINITDRINAALDAKVGPLVKALEKITDVALSDHVGDLGQIVGSEHYEACWLDCADIAKEALATFLRK